MGGMARRATAIKDYRRNHPDLAFLMLETGNALKQSDNLDDPASRWVVEALNEIGVQAVNTTAGDFRRLDRLAALDRLPKDLRTAYVSTNLAAPAGSRFSPKPFMVEALKPEAGGEAVRIGVLALSPPEAGRGASVEEALRRYLREVERESDLVVLLARLADADLVRLARMFPGLDVIVNGSGAGEGREFPKVGNTVIVEAAHGGVALGILELSWDRAGHIDKSTNTLIPLPPQLDEDPGLAAIAEKAHRDSIAFQEEEARKSPPVTMESIFAGSAQCKDCHEKAYRVWAHSGHARALEALRKTGDHFNSDCLECHVTGYGVSQGFVNALRTPGLAAVHCEACHAASLAHVKSPQAFHPGLGDMRQFRRRIHKDFCLRCHTPENSPRFDFDEYWKKIAH
jgi:2',3'-cyclic-nucleotide 2'-phosphodiesterase (5'-nucleotidase family)